jgi:hypothetical protein
LDELHAFAHTLGLKRAWFQAHASLPHYDITIELRGVALTHGAVAADRRTLISRGRLLKIEMIENRLRGENQLRLFE